MCKIVPKRKYTLKKDKKAQEETLQRQKEIEAEEQEKLDMKKCSYFKRISGNTGVE